MAAHLAAAPVSGRARLTRLTALAGACVLVSVLYAVAAGYHDTLLVMLITLFRTAAGLALGVLLAIVVFAVRPLYKRLRVPFAPLALMLSLMVVTLLAILDLWERLMPASGGNLTP
jgi:hypothetical protein